MDHADIRKHITEGILQTFAQEDFARALRGYQREALASLAAWLSDPSGSRRGYIAHATGLGKTVLIGALVRIAFGLRVLVVVPTKTLVEQTAKALHPYVGGLLGHWSSLNAIAEDGGERIAIRSLEMAPLVVATEASLVKSPGEIARDFDPHVIVWDECHRSYGTPAQAALASFPEAVVVGCTATPDYLIASAGVGFHCVEFDDGTVLFAPPDRMARTHYPTCIDRRSLRWGVAEGWLARPSWVLVDGVVPLGEIPITVGKEGPDYDACIVDLRMRRHWPTLERMSVDFLLREEFRGRRAYALCPSVAAAQSLARSGAGSGIVSASISAETTNTERRKTLDAFHRGDVGLLSSVNVLREGWNDPEADTCLVLNPTASAVNYLQPIGRALRQSEKGRDKQVLILDVFRHHERFAPLAEPTYRGLARNASRSRLAVVPKALAGPGDDGHEFTEQTVSFAFRVQQADSRGSQVAEGVPDVVPNPSWLEDALRLMRAESTLRPDGLRILRQPARRLGRGMGWGYERTTARIATLQRLGVLGLGGPSDTLMFFDPSVPIAPEDDTVPTAAAWRGTHATAVGRRWVSMGGLGSLLGESPLQVAEWLLKMGPFPIRLLEPEGGGICGPYIDAVHVLTTLGASPEAIQILLPSEV